MKKFIFILTIFFNLSAIKIDRVILACDDNPLYLEFWPIVARAWKKIVGVQPTLALISKRKINIDKSLGDVIYFRPINGISTAMYAQCIRLLLPTLFENDVCIISDMDMIPVNKEYFLNSIKDIKRDDVFIVYRDLAYGKNYPQYPMCYNVAKGKVFKEVFNIKNNTRFSSVIKRWASFGFGWNTDERILFNSLRNWRKGQTHCIKLGHGVPPRIDRANWNYSIDLLHKNYYIDCHMLRPYSKNKNEIDKLVRLLKIVD